MMNHRKKQHSDIEKLMNDYGHLYFWQRWLFPRNLHVALFSDTATSVDICKSADDHIWFFQRWFIGCIHEFYNSNLMITFIGMKFNGLITLKETHPVLEAMTSVSDIDATLVLLELKQLGFYKDNHVQAIVKTLADHDTLTNTLCSLRTISKIKALLKNKSDNQFANPILDNLISKTLAGEIDNNKLSKLMETVDLMWRHSSSLKDETNHQLASLILEDLAVTALAGEIPNNKLNAILKTIEGVREHSDIFDNNLLNKTEWSQLMALFSHSPENIEAKRNELIAYAEKIKIQPRREYANNQHTMFAVNHPPMAHEDDQSQPAMAKSSVGN